MTTFSLLPIPSRFHLLGWPQWVYTKTGDGECTGPLGKLEGVLGGMWVVMIGGTG